MPWNMGIVWLMRAVGPRMISHTLIEARPCMALYCFGKNRKKKRKKCCLAGVKLWQPHGLPLAQLRAAVTGPSKASAKAQEEFPMNRKSIIAGILSIGLVTVLALAGCKSNGAGSDGGGSGSFGTDLQGRWVSEDRSSKTLEFTADGAIEEQINGTWSTWYIYSISGNKLTLTDLTYNTSETYVRIP
jgi:hypothetical protein